MANKQHLEAERAADVDRVMASARLSGQPPSPFMAGLLNEYRAGRLSSAQLLAKARAHYLGVDNPPKQ